MKNDQSAAREGEPIDESAPGVPASVGSETPSLPVVAAAGITADRPKTTLAEDELGFGPFVETVAAALASRAGDDGMVIAIHGRWGSGKTTAVNMIADELEHREAKIDPNRRTVVTRFNPWWFSEQKDLTHSFFAELNASIGDRFSARVRDGLVNMARKASGASEIISSILAVTPAVAAAPAVKAAGKVLKALGDTVDDKRSLEQIRSDLAVALLDQNRNILVIIDDVDRLVSSEVRQIFRLVKSVADLPRVTYLLVFDRQIATQALKELTAPDGPEWLEKIVQASFDLPHASQTDLNEMFVKRLSAIVGDEPVGDVVRWGNLLHGAIAPWLKTPRDVGRLANAIAMAWPSVKGEVYVGDFVAIETMRLFEPDLYRFVRSHPDDVTGQKPRLSGRNQKDFEKEILETVKKADRRDRAKTALSYIFPRLGAEFETGWSGETDNEAELNRRVSSPRRFAVYFNLGLNDGMVSSAELDALRASYRDPKQTRALIQTYVDTIRRNGRTRASVLLDTLMAHADSVPAQEAEMTARALLASADLFGNSTDGDKTSTGLPLIWAVSAAIMPILKKVAPEQGAMLITEAIDGDSPAFATFTVNGMSKEHGRLPETQAKPEAERYLPLDAVIDLENRLSSRIARDAKSGVLLQSDDAAHILFTWARLAGVETVRKWIKQSLKKPGFAIWLMKTFTGIATTQSFGDLVGKRIPSVNRESLAKLVDVDELEATAKDMASTGNDPGGAATNFIEGLSSIW